jgi:hypothetical protein
MSDSSQDYNFTYLKPAAAGQDMCAVALIPPEETLMASTPVLLWLFWHFGVLLSF